MDDPARPQVMLFAVRLWKEDVGDDSEYRGSARDVISGAFCSFRAWPDLTAFMVARLEQGADATIPPNQ